MVTQTKIPPLAVSNPWWGHDPSDKQWLGLYAYEECPTAFRRWKRVCPQLLSRLAGLICLQWGHRLSAMETLPRKLPGWWSLSAFNGATAFRRWKLRAKEELGRTSRLQWGHRLSAMETRVLRRSLGGPPRLQWGHRLSAMETPATLPDSGR